MLLKKEDNFVIFLLLFLLKSFKFDSDLCVENWIKVLKGSPYICKCTAVAMGLGLDASVEIRGKAKESKRKQGKGAREKGGKKKERRRRKEG